MIEDICTAFLPKRFADAIQYAPAEIGTSNQKSFPSHQNEMVGLAKQLFDHVMAPKVPGSYTPYAIERMTVLPNIVLLQKATSG